MIETFPQLLAELSERCLSVKRLPNQQIGVTGEGELTAEITQAIRRFKLDLLRLLPDESQKMREGYQQMLDAVNARCPPDWFGTAEMWGMLDEIERRLDAAITAGDWSAFHTACDDYKCRAISFFLHDKLFPQPGFDTDEQWNRSPVTQWEMENSTSQRALTKERLLRNSNGS